MKKNYLLLFFIALLFGTATMRGQRSYPLNDQVEYYFKLGKGYVKVTGTQTIPKFSCVVEKSDASIMKIGTNGTNSTFPIGGWVNGQLVSLKYRNGKLLPIGTNKQQFEYLTIDNKHYLKSTEDGAYNGYLTNKNGTITFESAPSEDAVFEFENKDGGNATEIAEKAKKMLNRLSFFQAYRYKLGDNFESSPFMGSGLGQYPLPILPDANQIIEDKWKYFSYKMYRNTFAGLKGDQQTTTAISVIETCEKALHINTPQAGTYVVISTKSQYEDKIRLNDNRSNELNFTPGSAAGPSHPAQYLMASAEGYTLTGDKSKAAVFYFDGQHLTGIDNGFGLGEAKYDLTANDQKAVIAQGKLEKTLDAGSYSLKVGDKFVKLDRTNGLSPSTSESDSHLFLEEATKFTLNTDDLGYISFFAPTAVKVPAGVEVYSGNINAQNSVITFNKVNTQEIPAKTAVLLRKVTGKGSFEVEKIASTTSTISNNGLRGYTVSSKDHLDNAYGLTVEGGKLVFKPLIQGVRAFRAVIYSNNGAGAPAYYPTAFAPEGIHGVTVDKNQAEVFDLAGRRVEAPVKGQVYVKNGKKFIQK